ncbi:MAG: helix-turn-helix transcriptional regulator, partial [Flavobacterium sp.]
IFQSNYSYAISETISEIINTTKTGITKRFFLESKALELLWLHTEQYNHEKKFGFDDHDFKKVDLGLLKKAKEYIHIHFDQEITLGILAKEVGTNETKIKQGFKKIYGKTFSEILRYERLNKAKLLLEDGELNIKETALLCGYKSTSMFTVRFKERFGTTPSNFKSSQSDVFVSQSEVL